ncbi:MAG: glycosyltransferase [Gaiellaceae bacterium]
MKVLLVAMYWPPAGGAGVQRTLKFAAHLPNLGFEVHVLAPDDPKWVHRDESLREPRNVTVHRARNIGPRSRMPAEELYGRRGLGRLAGQAPLLLRRTLVPDAAVLWNVTAIRAATSIVRAEGIEVVVTTSPPGSVHLVGLAAKRATKAAWVADLRDSIAAHPQRRRDLRGERRLAQLVARGADAVVAASQPIADEMKALGAERAEVVGNGCDFDDFAGLLYHPGERFRITHTGNFIGRRSPRPFLEAMARAGGDSVARFVGSFRRSDRDWAESLGLGDRLELLPHRAHAESLALQRDSEALLLLIPESGGRERGVLSAKVFEYLAAERPILAAVPPQGAAAALIRETGVGVVVPPADVDAIAEALGGLERRWQAGELDGTALPKDVRTRISRRARAEELAAILRSVA